MPTSTAPAITLAELCELVAGELRGEGDIHVAGTAILDVATAGEITLVDSSEKLAQLEESPAAAAIVPADFPECDANVIAVTDVHDAFAQVVLKFRPARTQENVGHSLGAMISGSARVHPDAQIHVGATIGDEVSIGPGAVIYPGARIMAGCHIGADTVVYPNAVLYEDTQVGSRVIIHAGAVIGAYGFGYRQVEGAHRLSAQLGFVRIDDDVEIGACATVDRGTYGATTIGQGTKIDNLVQVAHNCRLGKHNLICGQVGIAGSTTTGDYVVMAGQVGVRDHVHIGDGAILCSKAGVPNSVPEGEVMLGQPATPVKRQRVQMAAVAKLPEMRKDFRRLQQEVELLKQLLEQKETNSHADKAA